MRIKRDGNVMMMDSALVCTNYTDMRHIDKGFEKVRDNEYKCIACGTVMTVKEPVLVHDDKGRLKMMVKTESK